MGFNENQLYNRAQITLKLRKRFLNLMMVASSRSHIFLQWTYGNKKILFKEKRRIVRKILMVVEWLKTIHSEIVTY